MVLHLTSGPKALVGARGTGPLSTVYLKSANDLINAVYDKSGSNYGDVVQRCLKCEFNITPKHKRLEFEKFRQLVFEGVVEPLEKNYLKYLLYRGNR